MSKDPDVRRGAPAGLDPRARIIAAGVSLVARHGAAAATTRAIAAAASVQAPTIFRHFGDKNGLLDAIASQTMADFLASGVKITKTDDPVQDLRAGMEAFMAFGVGNPDVFLHMFARPGNRSSAVEAGSQALRDRLRRVAMSGRLSVSEERAYDIFHALARGTVFEILEKNDADAATMIESAGAVALKAIVEDNEEAQPLTYERAATTLLAHLSELDRLSPGEKLLMDELLSRLVDQRSRL